MPVTRDKCSRCGKPFDKMEPYTIHHIVRYDRISGKDEIICGKCISKEDFYKARKE